MQCAVRTTSSLAVFLWPSFARDASSQPPWQAGIQPHPATSLYTITPFPLKALTKAVYPRRSRALTFPFFRTCFLTPLRSPFRAAYQIPSRKKKEANSISNKIHPNDLGVGNNPATLTQWLRSPMGLFDTVPVGLQGTVFQESSQGPCLMGLLGGRWSASLNSHPHKEASCQGLK